FVSPGRQSFERNSQLRAVSTNCGFTRCNRAALLVPYFDRAEGRFKLLSEPEHHFFGRRVDRAAHPWVGVVKKGVRVRKGRHGAKERNENEITNVLAHDHRPNIGLPVLTLSAKIGLPMLFGKMSSRKKCSCPMTPTLVPLWRLTGISAST